MEATWYIFNDAEEISSQHQFFNFADKLRPLDSLYTKEKENAHFLFNLMKPIFRLTFSCNPGITN